MNDETWNILAVQAVIDTETAQIVKWVAEFYEK